MGHFSNGSEGMAYQEKYCSRCVHDDPDMGCEIWGAHILYCGELTNVPAIESPGSAILDMLIPRTGTTNKQCKLFFEKA